MPRYAMKMMFLGALVVLGMFFGVDMATRGIERINGPMAAQTAADAPLKANVAGKPGTSAVRAPNVQAPPPAAERPPERLAGAEAVEPHDSGERPLVRHLAAKTGDLLQILAHYAIKGFVSLLDGILD